MYWIVLHVLFQIVLHMSGSSCGAAVTLPEASAGVNSSDESQLTVIMVGGRTAAISNAVSGFLMLNWRSVFAP